MERDMNWSFGLHLNGDAKPVIRPHTADCWTIEFFGDFIYPSINLFARSDAHRRWFAAVSKASAEFWEAERSATKPAMNEALTYKTPNEIRPEPNSETGHFSGQQAE